MSKKTLIKALLLFIFTTLKSQDNFLLIGHRGAMGILPENTLSSIELAINLGCDAVEIDVFKCASGELVVFHDKKVNKLTNGYGRIEKMSLDEIKKLIVIGNEKIPTLTEVLDLINGKIILNIELKGRNTAIPTHKLLNKYFLNSKWTPDKILISSFIQNELTDFRMLDNNVRLGVLIEKNIEKSIKFSKRINAFSINPDYKLLDKKTLMLIKENGFKVYPWTVNDMDKFNSLFEMGVDGIITDFPNLVR